MNPIHYNIAVRAMNDELREELHSRLSPCTDDAFMTAYRRAHLKRFGEDFEDFLIMSTLDVLSIAEKIEKLWVIDRDAAYIAADKQSVSIVQYLDTDTTTYRFADGSYIDASGGDFDAHLPRRMLDRLNPVG